MHKLLIFSLILLPASLFAEEADWSARVELGYGYDSNVAVDDVDLSTERGDQFQDLSLSAGVEKALDENWTLNTDITLSEKKYRDFDAFDGRLALVSLNLERKYRLVDFGLAARHIDYQLDHEGFLALTQYSPSLSWFVTRSVYLRAAYEYSDERFDQQSSRDNQQDRFSLRAYWFMNGLKQYLQFHARHADDDARDERFSNHSTEYSVRFHQSLGGGVKDVTLELAARYQERDYDRFNSATVARRKDRRSRFEVSLEVPMSERFALIARASDNDYRSNVEVADYAQRVFSLTLRYER
jgi:hypothetical protein